MSPPILEQVTTTSLISQYSWSETWWNYLQSPLACSLYPCSIFSSHVSDYSDWFLSYKTSLLLGIQTQPAIENWVCESNSAVYTYMSSRSIIGVPLKYYPITKYALSLGPIVQSFNDLLHRLLSHTITPCTWPTCPVWSTHFQYANHLRLSCLCPSWFTRRQARALQNELQGMALGEALARCFPETHSIHSFPLWFSCFSTKLYSYFIYTLYYLKLCTL